MMNPTVIFDSPKLSDNNHEPDRFELSISSMAPICCQEETNTPVQSSDFVESSEPGRIYDDHIRLIGIFKTYLKLRLLL